MNFISTDFLIFFPVVAAIYFFLANRLRWVHLLVASYVFYMAWIPVYALLMLLTTLSVYLCAIGLDRTNDARVRTQFLWLGVGGNLGVLFAFKYYNFFEGQFTSAAAYLGLDIRIPMLDIILPLGISFYTFQAISYLVDVYRRGMPAERHLGILLLYVSFFPQLVAGPIERGTILIPKLRALILPGSEFRVRFEYERVVSGLRLMLLGFFKKIVLADNFAKIVQPVYDAPGNFSDTSALVATVAFAFQIFFDFSAYTDIARGTSRVFGFELMENFRRPYFAPSIPEFWQRWHISLSTWFRDYLYIPLGGNRVAKWRWFLNLWIVFLLCGFWHGASWTFMIWGALHGLYYFLTFVLSPPARRLAEWTGLIRSPIACRVALVAITFALACWAWVMFRAASVSDAIAIWGKIVTCPMEIVQYALATLRSGTPFLHHKLIGLGWMFAHAGHFSAMPLYLAALTVAYFAASFKLRAHDDGTAFALWNVRARWATYFIALTSIAVFGNFGTIQFIYFQF